MDNNKRNSADLMSKYHANQISSDEYKELVSHVNSSSDEELRMELLNLWNSFTEDKSLSSEKKADLYKGIHSRIHTPFIIQFKRHWMQIAASLLFVLMGVWTISLYHENTQIKELVSQNVVFNSGDTGHSEITLPDGTSVLLNAKSSLTYQQDFGYTNREVALSGEGLFKVKRDTTKQFIVRTGFMDITVLGTTFNVNAYENQDIITMSLIEGSVRVNNSTNPSDFLYVKPNEKVTFYKGTGKLKLEASLTKSAISWSQKELVFNNSSLQDVFSSLEHKFNVDIRVDSNTLLEDKYSGVFDDKDIDDILRVLQLHYKFNYKKKENIIYIKR